MIKTILIIDDDKEVSEIVKNYIESSTDYQVELSDNGHDGISIVNSRKIDMILLDVEMPSINGIATLEIIRRNEFNNDIPVIFMTGKEDKETVMKCLSLGVEGYILKPVNKELLINKITEVMNKLDALKANKTILLVDDDTEFLKMVNLRLSKYYKVLAVNSGKTALDYLGCHKVDLIVLDYMMPLYNGRDILNMLRKRESTAATPVIIVSSLNIHELEEVCNPYNPIKILNKPVNMELLIQIISSTL